MESNYLLEDQSEVILGYLNEPFNTLLTTAKYLPNKVGGQPAFITPDNTPSQKCKECGYKMSFLMQLYANIDEEDSKYHRMLYVFACISPKCINKSDCVKVYRGYAVENGQFADNNEIDEMYQLTDDDLVIRGIREYKDEEEEMKQEKGVDPKEKGIQLDEYLIETDLEQSEVTKFYLKESLKIKNKEKDDGDENMLEDAFLSLQATSKKDKSHIDKLVKNITDENDELINDEEANEKLDEVEMKELEKLIENKHANYTKIAKEYKLFEYVARQNNDQVVRYIKHRHPKIEPLWMSDKNKLTDQQIPNCSHCGQKRLFEFQIMPQIFDVLPELILVDWNTIVVYTCPNKDCIPSDLHFYREEFAYIQMSDDFAKVQYGDDEQIKKQKQQKKQKEKLEGEQIKEKSKEEGEGQEEEQKKAKKKKNKKKNKEMEDKQIKDQVNNEVQSQLKDLMENFSLNPQQQ